jgi:hypothetical protein
MKRLLPLLLLTALPAMAQPQAVKLDLAKPAPQAAAKDAGPAAPAVPTGPMTLLLRGLDKITGRPTDITAPIGKVVNFATLTITVRSCYSTPPSEPPRAARSTFAPLRSSGC